MPSRSRITPQTLAMPSRSRRTSQASAVPSRSRRALPPAGTVDKQRGPKPRRPPAGPNLTLRLPYETLLVLFYYCTSLRRKPFQLAHVCQRWRSIYHSHAHFWTSIAINPQYEKAPEMLQYWLSKTKAALLDITLVFKPHTPLRANRVPHPFCVIAEILRKEHDRWRSLDIIAASHHAVTFFSSCIVSTPKLERVSITLTITGVHRFVPLGLIIPQGTSNVALEIFPSQNSIDICPRMAHAITSLKLTLCRTYAQYRLLHILKFCSNLEELWIGALSNSTDVIQDFPVPYRAVTLEALRKITLSKIVHITGLRALDFQQSLHTFVAHDFAWTEANANTLATILPRCPFLSSVILQGNDLTATMHVPFAIHPLVLPLVTSLDVTGQVVLDALLEQLSLPRATTLRINCFSGNAIAHLLRRCPLVQTLDASFTRYLRAPASAPHATPSAHPHATLPHLSHVCVHYRGRSISFTPSQPEGGQDEAGLSAQAEVSQEEMDAVDSLGLGLRVIRDHDHHRPPSSPLPRDGHTLKTKSAVPQESASSPAASMPSPPRRPQPQEQAGCPARIDHRDPTRRPGGAQILTSVHHAGHGSPGEPWACSVPQG
ncbi:hypothetical protein BOTBODRAFT_192987 [Botryobasidium botryosum FD-172 SS1]|uniref:F-box domain-containing protein n=1 Tax=Botryobasidium botryosum (strain FD-172 SS1) TaxID=930990 RepID=A0A067M4P2_BOTB1|nr:hypothetical protein BOTBODRAFT_192987 [Botryobasidium botryosum FD-172 SS1]